MGDQAAPASSSLQPLLQWMQLQLKVPLTLEAIAHRAHTSTRTLTPVVSPTSGRC